MKIKPCPFCKAKAKRDPNSEEDDEFVIIHKEHCWILIEKHSLAFTFGSGYHKLLDETHLFAEDVIEWNKRKK